MLPLTRVQPGNLITSELINSIIDQLNGLKGRPGNLPLILGPLAEQTGTLVALGTGFEASGGIWLDGEPLLSGSPTRGISLVILNPSLKVKFRAAYDTFGDAGSSARLVQDLQAAAQPSDIVVGVTHDAFVNQLQPSAKAALASIGAAALGLAPADTRSAAAFIGVVPTNRSSAQFNYLVSVQPADAPGFSGNQRLTAMPFAWGVYSISLQRFLVGAASGQLPSGASLPTSPTLTSTFPTFPTFTMTLPTDFTLGTFPTLPTFTMTLPTDFTLNTFVTVPTLTVTLPTDFTFNTLFTAPTMNLPTLATLVGFVRPEDEVTVLPGLGSSEKRKLSNAGVTSVNALVNSPVNKVASALNINNEAAASLIGRARQLMGG